MLDHVRPVNDAGGTEGSQGGREAGRVNAYCAVTLEAVGNEDGDSSVLHMRRPGGCCNTRCDSDASRDDDGGICGGLGNDVQRL